MLLAGKNIMQSDTPLVKVSIDYFVNAIKNPKENLVTEIRRLRMLRTLDIKRYNQIKRNLPYVTCGMFSPPFRRKENFAWIQHFFIDIDQLTEKGIVLSNLKEKLIKDNRIKLVFDSPSNDGLKVLFQLSDKCYDPGKYSVFYKIFADALSKQYDINQVVDKTTSDVSRACFFSHDSNVFYNPNCETIDMNKFVDFNNLHEIKQTVREINKEQAELPKPEIVKEKNIIDKDVFQEITRKLNPNIKIKPEKNIYVPEELDNIIEKVKQQMNEYDIEIESITNIHYGKKFVLKYNNSIAEINLFYGSKGFRPVISPKNGTNNQLNELCYKIMCELFYEKLRQL